MMNRLLDEDIDVIVRASGNEWIGLTIRVTGGAGFLGSWLYDVVLQRRAEVHGAAGAVNASSIFRKSL